MERKTPLKRTGFKKKPVVKHQKPVAANTTPPPAGVKRLKLCWRLAERDGPRCHYCDRTLDLEEMTLDHIKPQSLGGTHAIKNLVLCCKPCNSWKGQRPYSWAITNCGPRRKSAKVTSHIAREKK